MSLMKKIWLIAILFVFAFTANLYAAETAHTLFNSDLQNKGINDDRIKVLSIDLLKYASDMIYAHQDCIHAGENESPGLGLEQLTNTLDNIRIALSLSDYADRAGDIFIALSNYIHLNALFNEEVLFRGYTVFS